MTSLSAYNPSEHVQAAVDELLAREPDSTTRAEALVELALDLQRNPRSAQDVHDALYLYEQALSWIENNPLYRARAQAGQAATLRRMPSGGLQELQSAHSLLTEALTVLRSHGNPEETAEAELVYGLVIQSLASTGAHPLRDSIAAYQRALRVFTPSEFPREYAIIHNNLATAYLSMDMGPSREGMSEALAVRSYRSALEVISAEQDPAEYAMLQNNLGNALQSSSGPERPERLQEAIAAYDEALRIRTPEDMPLEYANTLANKANAFMHQAEFAATSSAAECPTESSSAGALNLLQQAVTLLDTAHRIFSDQQAPDRAALVERLANALRAEISAASPTTNSPSGTQKVTP